jgi:hypothetical protein
MDGRLRLEHRNGDTALVFDTDGAAEPEPVEI